MVTFGKPPSISITAVHWFIMGWAPLMIHWLMDHCKSISWYERQSFMVDLTQAKWHVPIMSIRLGSLHDRLLWCHILEKLWVIEWFSKTLHCKCKIVTLLVFSHASLPGVLHLSFLLLLVGHITSHSCSTSLRCNLSDYWYLKQHLEYSWQWHTTKIQNSCSFTFTV